MKQINSCRRFSFAALCGLVILALIAGTGLSLGHSQGNSIGGPDPSAVNGIEVYLNKDPNTKIFGNDNFLSGSNLCGQWIQNQGTLEQALVSATGMLNSSGRLPDGVTIVRQRAILSKDCTAHATQPTGFIEISAKLPGNEFVFELTTPGPLPRDLDPKLSITFDVTATARVEIPTTVRHVELGPARLLISNVVIHGKDFPTTIALALEKIQRFFTGRDLLAELTKDRTFEFAGAKTELASFSKALDDAAKKLPSLESEFDSARKVLILRGPGGSDNRCISGFVWREAVEGDDVCVTPAVRAQGWEDNKHAGERRVGGPDQQKLQYCFSLAGKDFKDCMAEANAIACKPGFVWRTAVPNDFVCVTPQVRDQTLLDNRLARTRRLDAPADTVH